MSAQLIAKAGFAQVLNKPSSNKQQAKSFLVKYPLDYEIPNILLPDNFELKANKKQTQIRLIDRTDFANPRIAYALDIEISTEKIAHKTCTQILVWASARNEELLIGFPRKIFNHLLQNYLIVITDKQQTADGKRFWERRIIQALEDNRFVYFCDKTGETYQLQQIDNEDSFFETFEPMGWGNDKARENKLFIISLAELK